MNEHRIIDAHTLITVSTFLLPAAAYLPACPYPPAECSVRALPGDNLFSIAQRYGISFAEIVDMNRQISDPSNVKNNQLIYVPC